jgi:hypothetical protein
MEASRTAAARVTGALRAAGPRSVGVTLLGGIGALLILVTEFATIAKIDIGGATCSSAAEASQDACRISGFEQHGGAFLLLGLLGLVMALGAGRGASKPAASALVAIGAVVLAFGIIRDLPKTNQTGLIGLNYDEAKAGPGTGLYLEIVGGVLCIGAGVLRLTARREDLDVAEAET